MARDVIFRGGRARGQRIAIGSLSLMDAVPALCGGKFRRPEHLAPLVDALEDVAAGRGVPTIVTCPPRHGKSRTITAAISWMLLRDPTKTHAIASYSQRLAIALSKIVRRQVVAHGLTLSADERAMSLWRTEQDGGMLATGTRGSLTGFGISGLAIVDDAMKGIELAHSLEARDVLFEWFDTDFLSRLEPGAVPFVVGTRWHDDDLTGRLLRGKCEEFPEWRHIHLRALEIDDEGVEHALWPERYPLERLRAIRASGTSIRWNALMQGDPQPARGRLFGPATFAECPIVFPQIGESYFEPYPAAERARHAN